MFNLNFGKKKKKTTKVAIMAKSKQFVNFTYQTVHL